MKEVKVFETWDGQLHRSYQLAKDHVDKAYGDQLTKMARELVAIEKYTDMVDKLDGYKGSMQRLLDLSADFRLETLKDRD